MAQFSVKKNAQFDEAFFSKEKLPILMALKKNKKTVASHRIVPPISFVSIAFKTPKKGRFWNTPKEVCVTYFTKKPLIVWHE